jgi:hypothetical protein
MKHQYEDISYLKSIYPDSTKKIMDTIKATCDEYDYEGSCLYDQYPDRVWMEKISNSIYEQIKDDPMEAQDHRDGRDIRRNLIDVLLLNEILCRRGWCDRGEHPGHNRDHGGCRDCHRRDDRDYRRDRNRW